MSTRIPPGARSKADDPAQRAQAPSGRLSADSRETVRETGRKAGDSPTEPADYAALNLVFAAALGGLAFSAERGSWWREPLSGVELLPLGAATFALAKVLARERIGSWVREPFVAESEGDRRPRGRRLRYAVGELLTCTRCVGAWSALSLVGLRLTAPRAGRTVSAVLATSALNDFLQAAFRVLTETSTQIEQSG